MPMWTLTGFADEISADVEEQLRTLALEDIRWLELRGAWGKNVLDLADDELAALTQSLEEAGIHVSSIGSPIGKISIADPFPPHLERFDRALAISQSLGAPYVRVFSFFIPEGDDPAAYTDEVLGRMAMLTREAEKAGITLLHENEKHIYGDIPARCLQVLETINSPALRAAWDPANFVQCGVRPYVEGYEAMRPYIAYVHVKDALFANRKVVPAGEGDGQWRETIAALHASGFDGFFSLEPHLLKAETYAGFSGPELWQTASRAFKALLSEQRIDWM
jgi:sugar phosphate isomerase/epimerase